MLSPETSNLFDIVIFAVAGFEGSNKQKMVAEAGGPRRAAFAEQERDRQ